MIMETAKEILQKGHICDNCLGRQFGQILSGMTNKERGRALRTALALEYAVKPFPTEKSNFSMFNFRKGKNPETKEKSRQCFVCGGLFESLEKWAEQAAKKLQAVECRTFVVSTSLSVSLIRLEEALWEEIGIEHCEPIKSEINRELGKLVAGRTGKEPDEGKPDVGILLDLERGRLDMQINPVYVYGRYQKLVRGIPQTKWEMYKETVEDIIAKPFMRESGGRDHAMHASGREDIDARCLDWRPFVLEIGSPMKRTFDLRKMEAEVNRTRKVRVSGLRYSDRKEVVAVKSLMPDKSYRVLVLPEKPVSLESLKKLKRISLIKQQTPTRVLHRRADKTRTKRMKSVSWKALSGKRLEFTIKGEAGLYIKELVHGDNGRTRPSFSEVLGVPLKVKELDVVKIHLPKARRE
ncbi:MAG TPA: tRNA pseudouridine(54/55) synthase Pus10 [archaeon]|nr:tRNA pseudouridine(54/55) synthase Pus10 [archaeon]